jgi:hypothetical protein
MPRRKTPARRTINEDLRLDEAPVVIPRPTDSDESGTAPTIGIEQVQPVGSYSWIKTSFPTILVPGEFLYLISLLVGRSRNNA